MKMLSDGGSTPPASTKREPDELRPHRLYGGRPVRSGSPPLWGEKVKKTHVMLFTHGVGLFSCLSYNAIRYFLPIHSGVLELLLESNEKEHGYD